VVGVVVGWGGCVCGGCWPPPPTPFFPQTWCFFVSNPRVGLTPKLGLGGLCFFFGLFFFVVFVFFLGQNKTGGVTTKKNTKKNRGGWGGGGIFGGGLQFRTTSIPPSETSPGPLWAMIRYTLGETVNTFVRLKLPGDTVVSCSSHFFSWFFFSLLRLGFLSSFFLGVSCEVLCSLVVVG